MDDFYIFPALSSRAVVSQLLTQNIYMFLTLSSEVAANRRM